MCQSGAETQFRGLAYTGKPMLSGSRVQSSEGCRFSEKGERTLVPAETLEPSAPGSLVDGNRIKYCWHYKIGNASKAIPTLSLSCSEESLACAAGAKWDDPLISSSRRQLVEADSVAPVQRCKA